VNAVGLGLHPEPADDVHGSAQMCGAVLGIAFSQQTPADSLEGKGLVIGLPTTPSQ
jgi:hypothetical protein